MIGILLTQNIKKTTRKTIIQLYVQQITTYPQHVFFPKSQTRHFIQHDILQLNGTNFMTLSINSNMKPCHMYHNTIKHYSGLKG